MYITFITHELYLMSWSLRGIALGVKWTYGYRYTTRVIGPPVSQL